jgi:hypothetical protein
MRALFVFHGFQDGISSLAASHGTESVVATCRIRARNRSLFRLGWSMPQRRNLFQVQTAASNDSVMFIEIQF